ncbi:hypothetical protein Ciccas_013853, partial [Cichlidogyrus casuarinus]
TDYFYYFDGPISGVDVIAVMLKYEEGVNVLLVMPKVDGSLKDFNNKFTEEVLKQICEVGTYTMTKLELSIPRFELSTSYQLSDQLQAIGIKKAFSDGAELKGMAKRRCLPGS